LAIRGGDGFIRGKGMVRGHLWGARMVWDAWDVLNRVEVQWVCIDLDAFLVQK